MYSINFQYLDTFGNVFKNGNVCFLPSGTELLSPFGNKLKFIDLKRNHSNTFCSQPRSNISQIAINSFGTHAFIADERGSCLYVNIINDLILHQFFPGNGDSIHSIQFSPDGNYLAIGLRGIVRVYSVANFDTIIFNPVTLLHTFKFSLEAVTCIHWSDDGRLLAVGGENGVAKVFPAFRRSIINSFISELSERASIVLINFSGDRYNIFCVDSSGKVSLWSSSFGSTELITKTEENEYLFTDVAPEQRQLMSYMRKERHDLMQFSGSSWPSVLLTAATIKRPNLLFSAFSNGVFIVFDLAGFTLLQNFRATDFGIKTIAANSSGDWVAIGCGQGSKGHQLMVWEWNSETYILKQQSHIQTITSAAYSPDGSVIATGAEDGKVKVWNVRTSFCVVTFADHNAGVTDICFTQAGKAILSASLEGTVRAHDMKRYRNFRTMAAPKQTQLNSLCSDESGDIVMAASRDQYEIYVWSLETGNLLEVLIGHSNLIQKLSCHETTLASVSLDKTLRLWNILEASCTETVQLMNEGLDVKHSPTSSILAVLCYDSCISLFEMRNLQQIGIIETKLDTDSGRHKNDKIKKQTSERNRTFTCIAFSPDGLLILAGGQSNTFCLYSVKDQILLRSFRLSCNLSLDGVTFDYDYRKMTEFGHLDLFDLSDSEDETKRADKKIPLPGTRHTDLSERGVNPIICATCLAFSPTGQNFAVVSTEGVSIYTLNSRRFDPFRLDPKLNPDAVLANIEAKNYTESVCAALRLNDKTLLRLAIEEIPITNVKVTVQQLGITFVERLLIWIGSEMAQTKHIHFYDVLLKEILTFYGSELKESIQTTAPIITSIQQALAQQKNILLRISEQNKYSLEYLLAVRKMSNLNTGLISNDN